MVISLTDARRLIECRKLLEVSAKDPPVWDRKPNRDGRLAQLTIIYRVSMDGAMPQGLLVRIVTFVHTADYAMFQLESERPDSRTHDTLFRLEWKPLRGHANPFKGPPELAGAVFSPGETHCHSALDNCVASEDRLTTGEPPVARPVTDLLPSFQDALAYFSGKLNIVNPGVVPSPRWQTSLFEVLTEDG